MQADKLANEVDRKHAEREERRKRARTYKDRWTQPRETAINLDTGAKVIPSLEDYEREI